jgi:hypothetical protein
MKFNRKLFSAIAGAAARALAVFSGKVRRWLGDKTTERSETGHHNKTGAKPLDRLNRKHIFGGLGLGILVLLCLRSRAIRFGTFLVLTILFAGIVGGAIGTITGSVCILLLSVCATIWMWLRKLIAKLTANWRSKDPDSEYFVDRSTSAFSRWRSVRSQLRMAASQPRAERLQTIARLQAAIRSRMPNLSIQDLQDLNLLGREWHQIIDEESWSPIRRSRVDRIAEIRNSRRNRGQNLPSGLNEADEEAASEFIVTYSDLLRYGAFDDDDPDGIGDLSCEYNARSLFLRCAVNPGAETCEGCRDYRSRDLADPQASS